jgi:signal peptidase I
MSVIVTGLGELYSGFPQKGITLALARSISLLIIPFYTMIYAKYSYMTEVLISIICVAAITVFSPVYAYNISLKRKKIIVQSLSSMQSIVIFALSNVIITTLAIIIFASNFSIMRSNNGSDPLLNKGDIIVLKKGSKDSFNRGEMVLFKGDVSRFARIIGLYGDNIVYKKGRFSIDGSELFQSIFTESEMKKLALTDYDVISESDGAIKYPVIQKKDDFIYKNTLKNNEYLAVPDNRESAEEFTVVKGEDIYGRVEGILFSLKRFKFLITPFLVYD